MSKVSQVSILSFVNIVDYCLLFFLFFFFTLLLGLCGLFLDWLKLRQHWEHAFNGFARADLRFASRLKLPRHILGELSVSSVSRFNWQNKINALCSIKKTRTLNEYLQKIIFFLKVIVCALFADKNVHSRRE